jgi:hypothetical protein
MTDLAPGGAAADLIPTNLPADQARAKIAELTQNPDWVKRHLSGDHETKTELARLHEIAFRPAPGSIISGAPSIEAQREETAAHLGTLTDIPADVLEHVRTGASVSADEYRMAVARKDSLFGDPEWRAKYFAGNHEAKKQKALIDIILASPIKLGAA